ncbi:O-antigen ligase family protein [Stieleria maiorica]|uniref:O-antigen ligase family protein n=1 Tax=Stieleria maiorica TaxID=2795974 RepID=UPI00142F379F|nr:O-antigen ligase family protein [Stieleria maiorica]
MFCGLGCALLSFAVWLLFGAKPTWQGGWPGWLMLGGMLALAAVAGLHLVPLPDRVVSLLAPGVSKWMQGHAALAGITESSSVAVDAASGWFVGSRLALNAGGSFQFLIRAVAAASLFAMVCCLESPERRLRHLSVAAVVVAAALALFGIVQHFGSHDGLAYWTYEIRGGLGFGPFINRNHYPFFINMGLGLALGLLMERLEKMGRHWYRLFLADGIATWLFVALIFIIASLIVCGSRGGILSAMLALTVVLLLRLSVSGIKRWLVLGVGIAALTTLLLVWVGFDFYESRLNMLAESDRYSDDGRWILWRAALMSVPEFPWFGSGGETYRYWETIYVAGDPQWTSETNQSIRADNEFLDVLNEYGIAGLLSLMLIAGGVLSQVVVGARGSALSAGACIGLLAVHMHSFVDFGLRVPATGAFAVILAGFFCCQPVDSAGGRFRLQSVQRFGGSAAAVTVGRLGLTATALLLIIFTFFAIHTKRRYHQASRWSIAAGELMGQSMPEQSLEMMVRAAEVTAEDISRHLQIARASQLAMRQSASPAAQGRLMDLINEHSIIAMKLCPLAWQPSVWLANYGCLRKNARERLVGLHWARRLHPGDPNLAYLTGKLALEQSGIDEAVEHWRESLTYSTKYLPEILAVAGTRLRHAELLERLLPADPVVTLEAALYFQQAGDPEGRGMYATRTLHLIANPSTTKRRLDDGQAYEMQSRCYGLLGQSEATIASLRLALNHDPTKVAWRTRLARLLMDSQRLEDALREVRIALQLEPEASDALRLQKELSILRASMEPSR